MKIDEAIEKVSDITEEEACEAVRKLDCKLEKLQADIIKSCAAGDLEKAAKYLHAWKVTNELREFVREQRGF